MRAPLARASEACSSSRRRRPARRPLDEPPPGSVASREAQPRLVLASGARGNALCDARVRARCLRRSDRPRVLREPEFHGYRGTHEHRRAWSVPRRTRDSPQRDRTGSGANVVVPPRRDMKSSNTSPHAQACSRELSVRTPSTSKRQARTVAGSPSIAFVTGTGDSHGAGCRPPRASSRSAAAVVSVSRARAARRSRSSHAGSESPAARRALPAASSARCHSALSDSRSTG